MGEPLNRESILAAQDIKRERVPVPEWGGDVFVAVMPGADRWEYEVAADRARKRARANGHEANDDVTRLLATVLVDEQGARLFTEADVKALGEKSGVVLARLFRVAIRLNGIGDAEVERIEGN